MCILGHIAGSTSLLSAHRFASLRSADRAVLQRAGRADTCCAPAVGCDRPLGVDSAISPSGLELALSAMSGHPSRESRVPSSHLRQPRTRAWPLESRPANASFRT
jgi:hypothetical protein